MSAPEVAAELERAIHAHIVSMPAAEQTGSGRLYIKVDLGESKAPPDAPERYVGVLFLSMPRVGADREWLTKVMEYVRDGFERGRIPTGAHRVTLDADQSFESFHDDEAGIDLLNLPATLTVDPRDV